MNYLKKPQLEEYDLTQEWFDLLNDKGFNPPPNKEISDQTLGIIIITLFVISCFMGLMYGFLELGGNLSFNFETIFGLLFLSFVGFVSVIFPAFLIGLIIICIINFVKNRESKEVKVLRKNYKAYNRYIDKLDEYNRMQIDSEREAEYKRLIKLRRKLNAEEDRKLRYLAREQRKKKIFWENIIGDGITFEEAIAELFTDLGHNVQKTKTTGDEGVDLILKKDGKKIVVQCKAIKAKVSQSVARDLLGAKIHFNSDEAILCCINGVTEPTYKFALKNNIKIFEALDYINLQTKLSEEDLS